MNRSSRAGSGTGSADSAIGYVLRNVQGKIARKPRQITGRKTLTAGGMPGRAAIMPKAEPRLAGTVITAQTRLWRSRFAGSRKRKHGSASARMSRFTMAEEKREYR